ncbi:hypothetical protein AY600_12010 [Phormidium willei BDU 130791]|nr:hypothetical protein AY600_12010 [Phormidium willei BDU 130791]
MTETKEQVSGLRVRQKTQRHDAILAAAERHFATRRLDDVKMRDIARDAGVSTPTVFNYFGSKDELLLAVVLKGNAEARHRTAAIRAETGIGVDDGVCRILEAYSELSSRLLSKEAWRHAEAVYIRHPASEFVRRYDAINRHIVEDLSAHLMVRTPRNRFRAADVNFIARLLFSRWNALFLDYIRDDAVDFETHRAAIEQEMTQALRLLGLSPA